MSYPILYSPTESNFDKNGIGILSDCLSCLVTEERNGMFEMDMEYPLSGIHYDKISRRSIIKVRPNQTDSPQLFRVYSISRPMSGVVTVRAAHISYDLNGIPCQPYKASSASSAFGGLKTNAVGSCPFTFWTDVVSSAGFSSNSPKSIRSCIGGSEGSILDVYGGELKFDNFTVKLCNKRGKNNGVTIRYGKNLTDIKQEENCENLYTGIYPYWADIDGKTIVQLDERVVNAEGSYGFSRIKTVDFSLDFEEAPSQSALRKRAERYIKENKVGIPKVSISASFISLDQSKEFEGLTLVERVSLCDDVTVIFPALGVSETAKVTRVVYNAMLGRIESVQLGESTTDLSDAYIGQEQKIEKVSSGSFLQSAVQNATNWITNGKGYVVAVKDDSGNWSEILITGTGDIETASNVWRWSGGGFGFSSNGYNGPYTTAITQDGRIVADFITAGTLNANIIHGGFIDSVDVSLKGNFSVYNGNFFGGTIGYLSGNIGGIATDGIAMKSSNETNYFITTTAGVRAQSGNYSVYLNPSGKFRVEATAMVDDLYVKGKHAVWEYDSTLGKTILVAKED